MKTREPTGYENEPDEIFLPLPEDLYSAFYHLEMASFDADARYFLELLRENHCRQVLELGCGSGRVLGYLQKHGCTVTGIDTSRAMIALCRQTAHVRTLQMDMCRLGFSRCFDAVVIPYNSLNLLRDRATIHQCLTGLSSVLSGPCLLLLQLFTPDAKMKEQSHQRIFQFKLFDRPEGGKIIKETIRNYIPENETLVLEERYKIRPLHRGATNLNYARTIELAALKATEWLELLNRAGFKITASHGNYQQRPFRSAQDSTMLVLAQARP